MIVCCRVNPVREAEGPPSTEDIWNQLHKKILDSFTTVKQAFLVFDDVSTAKYNIFPFVLVIVVVIVVAVVVIVVVPVLVLLGA